MLKSCTLPKDCTLATAANFLLPPPVPRTPRPVKDGRSTTTSDLHPGATTSDLHPAATTTTIVEYSPMVLPPSPPAMRSRDLETATTPTAVTRTSPRFPCSSLALYSCTADNFDELTFQAGDRIRVLRTVRDDDEWWVSVQGELEGRVRVSGRVRGQRER